MTRAAWFEEWFNSPYYCLLYQDRDEQEASAFLEKLLQLLNPGTSSRLLDIPCGRGRHSRYLALKGYEVMGVDLSEKNISIARQFENDQLTFAVHDMRELFYINYFDIVFNLYTSMGYFETERENKNTIHTFSSALKKDGKLVIDYLNAPKVIREMKPFGKKQVDDVTFTIKKTLEEKTIVKKIDVDEKGNTFHFEERVMAYSENDFKELFTACNLKHLHSFGNYDLQPYNPLESDRLILIAEKI